MAHASETAAEPDRAIEPTAEVLFAVSDGIGTITFNRPQTRNALTFAMYQRLADIAEQANRDPALRVLVLTGAGDKAFAAGTDIAEFRAFRTGEDAIAYERRVDHLLTLIESCRLPTIAAISGACTGGGAAIAACCDLRIGTASTRFGFPIARTLGNCLSVANLARLAELVGPALVKDMIFTARLLDAEEAKAAGLLTEIVADHAALVDRTTALARQIAGHAPLTLRATKEGLRRAAATPGRDPGHDLIELCYTSEDFRQGLEAFLAKRPYVWTGR